MAIFTLSVLFMALLPNVDCNLTEASHRAAAVFKHRCV